MQPLKKLSVFMYIICIYIYIFIYIYIYLYSYRISNHQRSNQIWILKANKHTNICTLFLLKDFTQNKMFFENIRIRPFKKKKTATNKRPFFGGQSIHFRISTFAGENLGSAIRQWDPQVGSAAKQPTFVGFIYVCM